jgi:kynurenine formamidase
MKRTLLATILCLSPILSHAAPANEWLDLTYAFSDKTLYWPSQPSFKLEELPENPDAVAKQYYYNAKQFSAAEHGGTHMDAPSHFAKNKHSVAEIKLSQLMGKAVIINVEDKALPDDDYLITIGDIKNWEQQYGEIPQRAIVLFKTGYGKFWPDRLRYFGTSLTGGEAALDLHFPGLAQDTAKWLIDNRHIKAVGIDTASIDYGQTKIYPTHQVLAANNIPIFENVANMDKLYSPFAEIIALPMKIEDGTGAPLRIIAKPIPYDPTLNPSSQSVDLKTNAEVKETSQVTDTTALKTADASTNMPNVTDARDNEAPDSAPVSNDNVSNNNG